MSKKTPKVAALQMKPTTVTTGFGTGSYNPATGNVGYTLDPTLQQFRDMFYSGAEGMAPTEDQMAFARQVGDYGTGLFNRAANLDVNQMTQDYYNQQQNLLAPSRAQEESRMGDTLFKSGRTGAGIGVLGGGGYINPEQFGLQYAREQANNQMLMGAEDRARGIQATDLNNAFGYINTGNALSMQPYQNVNTLFGMGTGVEGLGYNTLNTVGQFAPLQMQWQQAQQQNQQAMNDAKAARSNNSFGRSLANAAVNAGLNYATGGMSGMMGGATTGGFSGGLFGFGGSSPSSGWGSSLGLTNNGFFNNVSPWNSSYSPQNLGIGMGGYNAPANFGGGTMGPSFY
jgi:hypothetical protein